MTSWSPIDLRALAAEGLDPEEPTSLMRTDGKGLLYPGRRHLLVGAPESGKTWLALTAVNEVQRGEGTALLMDFETNGRDVTRRLLALGCSPDQLAPDRIVYVRPDEPQKGDELSPLIELNVTLVVLDGVSEAMALNGWDARHETDVASFYAAFAVPFADTGATTLLLDHVPLDGTRELGSQHKRAGVDVSLMLKTDPWRPGTEGVGTLMVLKDRPGGIDWHGKSRVAAHVRFTPAAWEGGLDVILMPPKAAPAPTAATSPYLDQVRQGRHTAKEIADALEVSESTARRHLQALVPNGLRVVDGGRNEGGLMVPDTYFLNEVEPASSIDPGVVQFDAGEGSSSVIDQRHASPLVTASVSQRQTSVMTQVKSADDIQRHAPGGSIGTPRVTLDTADTLEPGWIRVQAEAGETPEIDEDKALARVIEMFDATPISDAIDKG